MHVFFNARFFVWVFCIVLFGFGNLCTFWNISKVINLDTFLLDLLLICPVIKSFWYVFVCSLIIANFLLDFYNFFFFSIVKVYDSLTQLVLCCNKLTTIPTELAECTKLQYLELSKNQISDLPNELGALKHMREIVISYNR